MIDLAQILPKFNILLKQQGQASASVLWAASVHLTDTSRGFESLALLIVKSFQVGQVVLA